MSFKAALDDPGADPERDTQFYTMLGTRGIWHDGWFANTVHAAPRPAGAISTGTAGSSTTSKPTTAANVDLAAENPDKAGGLQALWFAEESTRYGSLPLADLNIFETLTRWRPLVGERTTFTYYPGTADVGIGPPSRSQPVVLRCLPRWASASRTREAAWCFKRRRARQSCAVPAGRPAAYVNFHGRRGATGFVAAASPPGSHVLGASLRSAPARSRGDHTPLGGLALRRRQPSPATRGDVRTHPGSFGLAGGGVAV